MLVRFSKTLESAALSEQKLIKMSTMISPSREQLARNMSAGRQELADRIARALPRDGAMECQPGLHFRRYSKPGQRVYAFSEPAFCVIAQGRKLILLGADQSIGFGAVCGLKLPLRL